MTTETTNITAPIESTEIFRALVENLVPIPAKNSTYAKSTVSSR